MNVHSGAARRAVTVAAVGCGGVLVAALAAACGSPAPQPSSAASGPAKSSSSPSSSSPSSPSARPSSSKPAIQSAPRMPASQCPAAALRVTVSKTKGSAAAGTSYVPLDFTNISAHSCDMYGFPGVSFVTGHPGSQLGDAASRQTTFGSQTVTLASGGTAHAWLGVANAGNFPPSTCHQVTAHWLKVYPPGSYAALYAGFTSPACSKKITGASTPLTITPIRPGAGAAGTVP